MSRSIHATRRTLREEAKRIAENRTSLAEVQSALQKSRERLRRKRLIKRQVLSERRREFPALPNTPVSSIPIEVLDAGDFVHHPASPEDIRGVLAALPGAATQGMTRIQLSLGKEYMEERWAGSGAEPDPFTGRLSSEVFPGVFGGAALGSYYPERGSVWIFAYVYDPSRLPLPHTLCEFYLRLHALKTLVHEVAHHHDETNRVRRGRWLADRQAKLEWYAEKMEYEWTREVVLPYLESAYPNDTRRLRKWVAHRGGILLPLEFFAGDNRRTERNGLQRLVLSTSGAFENWVEELSECRSLSECRLAFARELHYSDAYPECLVVLDRILTTEPDWVPGLTCKADTLVHSERLDEALAVVEHAIRLEPSSPEAWGTRGDIFESRSDWSGLLSNCDAWEASGKPSKTAQREIQMQRAVAHCGLGNDSAMESSLHAHLATFRFRSQEAAKRKASLAQRSVLRRAGRV